MELGNGDKIIFGPIYCQETGREDLLGKTIMLTPQFFEHYNGFYSEYQECPGIYLEGYEEADSIYHLFGNELEEFYDCILIPATPEDLKLINDLRQAENEAIAADMGAMANFIMGK